MSWEQNEMLSNLDIGSILHFDKYYFTDTDQKFTNHYALSLLPLSATKYENNIYTAVITSKKPGPYNYIVLDYLIYKCLKCESYACFDRQHLQSLSDLSPSDQPLGLLTVEDYKKSYKILKRLLYTNAIQDRYIIGLMVRAWKKKIT